MDHIILEHVSRTHGKAERKGGLACAECRRSKLRCDRNVPCSNCVRRGCMSICPDGALKATKGKRVMQTLNQQLQEAVKTLTERVRQLEEALRLAQSQLSAQPHPLLQENTLLQNVNDLLKVFEETGAQEEEEQVDDFTEALGSLSIGDHGQTRFHGQSAGSDYLHGLIPPENEGQPPQMFSPDIQDLGLPWQIVELVYAFPFGSVTSPQDEARQHILDFLPPHPKTIQMTLLYYENVAYMYEPISHDDFLSNIIGVLYSSHDPPSAVWDQIHSHQVAVFYCIMAMGAAWLGGGGSLNASVSDDFTSDASKAAASTEWKRASQLYHSLACACLSLDPLTQEATSATIQALFVMTQYYAHVDKPGSERRWLMAGLMSRISTSVGLQRDPANWDLPAEETQRRRLLFWEMYAWDCWFSVMYGRPPSLDIRFVDCKFPEDKHSIVSSDGEKEQGFHAWKARFNAVCFSQALLHIFMTKAPDYSAVLELDHRLRKFPIPSSLRSPTSGNGEPVDGKSWNADPALAMQQHTVLVIRECTLMYIHRPYFSRALKADRHNPLKTAYGASVAAAFRSACLLLSGLRSVQGRHPKTASRIPFFWSCAFTSCMLLGCLVLNSPGCPLSREAISVFDQGVSLYVEHGKKMLAWPYTSKVLLDLHEKVRVAFNDYLRNGRDEQQQDPQPNCPLIRVLEGSTVVVRSESKSRKTSPASPSSSNSNAASPSSQSSGSVQAAYPGRPMESELYSAGNNSFFSQTQVIDSAPQFDQTLSFVNIQSDSARSNPTPYRMDHLGLFFNNASVLGIPASANNNDVAKDLGIDDSIYQVDYSMLLNQQVDGSYPNMLSTAGPSLGGLPDSESASSEPIFQPPLNSVSAGEGPTSEFPETFDDIAWQRFIVSLGGHGSQG